MPNRFTALITLGYKILERVGCFTGSVLLLLFRIYWGYQFFITGKGHLAYHSDFVEFLGSLGVPAPELNAWFVGGVECVGGALLLAGLFSRPVALVLVINMIVAYLSVAADRATVLNIFSDPEPFTQATPFFFLLLSLLVFSFGPGLFSLDAALGAFARRAGWIKPSAKRY